MTFKLIIKVESQNVWKITKQFHTRLSTATQHAMLPELGGKSGTECLNSNFPLLLCCVRDAAWSWFYISVSMTFYNT